MPTTNDNPYSASQILPEVRTSPFWRSLFYRAAIGFVVGVVVYGLIQFGDTSAESNKRARLFLSLCVIVPAVSTFTRSDSAKQSGRTGIIAAIVFCLVSVYIGHWLFDILGFAPPRTSGYDQGTYEEFVQRFSLCVFLYIALVSGYSLLYCRKQAPAFDSEDPSNILP